MPHRACKRFCWYPARRTRRNRKRWILRRERHQRRQTYRHRRLQRSRRHRAQTPARSPSPTLGPDDAGFARLAAVPDPSESPSAALVASQRIATHDLNTTVERRARPPERPRHGPVRSHPARARPLPPSRDERAPRAPALLPPAPARPGGAAKRMVPRPLAQPRPVGRRVVRQGENVRDPRFNPTDLNIDRLRIRYGFGIIGIALHPHRDRGLGFADLSVHRQRGRRRRRYRDRHRRYDHFGVVRRVGDVVGRQPRDAAVAGRYAPAWSRRRRRRSSPRTARPVSS